MAPIIEVVIDEDGNAQVSVQGVCGPGCQELTKDLEQALGVTTASKKTPEFFQKEKAKQGQLVKQKG
jgi:hypothetical protein